MRARVGASEGGVRLPDFLLRRDIYNSIIYMIHVNALGGNIATSQCVLHRHVYHDSRFDGEETLPTMMLLYVVQHGWLHVDRGRSECMGFYLPFPCSESPTKSNTYTSFVFTVRTRVVDCAQRWLRLRSFHMHRTRKKASLQTNALPSTGRSTMHPMYTLKAELTLLFQPSRSASFLSPPNSE